MKSSILTILLMFSAPAWGVDFDGTDDYVDCGSSITPSNVTVSVWVNSDAVANDQALAVIDDCGQNFAGFMLFISASNWYWWCCDGASVWYGTTAASGAISAGWTHLVGTWDGNTKVSYKDGSQVHSDSTGSGNIGYPGADVLRLGNRDRVTDDLYLDGELDDVRIYDRALSAAEVLALYNATRRTARKRVGGALATGLVGHWEMNDGPIGTDASGTDTILDSSGSGNHGDGVDGADGSLVYSEPARNFVPLIPFFPFRRRRRETLHSCAA